MAKKSVQDVDLSGQVVLCRVDFNVPLEGGKITDDPCSPMLTPCLRHHMLDRDLAIGGWIQAEQGAACSGLAASTLTHQSERFARFDAKTHTIDGLHEFPRAAEHAVLNGKVDFQVLDLKQGHGRAAQLTNGLKAPRLVDH